MIKSYGNLSQAAEKMLFTTKDNLKLYYQTSGDPQNLAILLIHGLGADHQMWQLQIEPFAEAGFYVIAPDMRSHGQSDAGKFSIVACARDLLALLNELKIKKAHLVGVSMGGLIVQQMVCDYPQRTDKIIICDSFSGVTSFNERFNAKLAAVLLKLLPASWQTKLLVSTYQRMGKTDVAEYFIQMLEILDVQQVREARAAVNAFDIIECLPDIRNPTLVLAGDGFGKTAIEMARKTAEGIQGATFQVLAGGGDPSNMLVPEEFNRQVLDFLP
jgi:pimeloyl-ACP methyl ester carboxylesterase